MVEENKTTKKEPKKEGEAKQHTTFGLVDSGKEAL